MVGLGGLEPPTPRLSSVCSNQLSYRPKLLVSLNRTLLKRCLFGLSKLTSKSRKNRNFKTDLDLADLRRDLRVSRKEVIQPQVPLRLPCYDFTPVTSHSLGTCLLAVGAATSGATDSHGVTGGVYKARERIHPCLLIRDY